MGLHPDLTPEQIETIEIDAHNTDNPVTQGPGALGTAPEGSKKRRYREVMTADVWKHFTKGVVQDDGSYDAVCNYCGVVYTMGNQKGTGSLRHHYTKGCKNRPNKRSKPDKLQQMLQTGPAAGDRGFMALTAHYIDDSWRIRKMIVNFTPLPSPHTGKNIAEALYSMLVMWNLDKRVFSLVLDNASSNDACIRELLNGQLKEDLSVDGSVFHQRCGCHILNLVVQDGLSVLHDEIKKVRETMKYLRHSQARMERFQLAASQVKVPNKKPAWDVPTRWNSTYLMLELALQLRPAIERYATLDKHYTLKPDDREWQAVQTLMDSLKIFYTATLKFSGTKYPTLNLYFPEFCEVYVSIKNMESSPYSFIVLMGSKMFAKWERNQTSGASSSDTISNIRAGLKSFMADKQTTEPVKSELEHYLSEPLDKTALEAQFDILAWWKLKVPKFPVLSGLARDILAVPASTVASSPSPICFHHVEKFGVFIPMNLPI
ncbi:hypothetical protein LUZ63_012963 [Rhynchospora breviuscula]|uniref:BED-type domain-containing protein n=1 Tax=Rhynchospora breviuscula TaxID=2022672 RepID=A0A9Q0C7M2_9POAL|nr:hypothetical protein LUZ63_012963 [Rhynchospora breviuscula]